MSSLRIEPNGENVPKVVVGILEDLVHREVFCEVLLVVGEWNQDVCAGFCLEPLREIERKDVAQMHRPGRTAAGHDREALARVCGVEKPVDIAPGTKELAANQWMGRLWESRTLVVGQFVRTEPVEKIGIIDLAGNGVWRNGVLSWHGVSAVGYGCLENDARENGAGHGRTPPG
jgi:hypothetical protein